MSDCKMCVYLDRFNCCCSYDPIMTCKAEMEEHDKRIRADEREKIYDKLDEGVCDICEHRYDGCVKECSENNWERETFMKWLKENN